MTSPTQYTYTPAKVRVVAEYQDPPSGRPTQLEAEFNDTTVDPQMVLDVLARLMFGVPPERSVQVPTWQPRITVNPGGPQVADSTSAVHA